MKIALVVPHIFMHPKVLPKAIFAPGYIAIDLARSLRALGQEVTLFAPGKVATDIPTICPDMFYFEQELANRGDDYIDLLKKHPFTFVTLARQVQAELVARAFSLANADQFDMVHIYCNEEELALPFAELCTKPVIFTHHDPFNFLIKYKTIFPKYRHLNWLSMSLAQRRGLPDDTNWLANIYHGLPLDQFTPLSRPSGDYIAYMGRIIQPKGVHLAIAAIKEYNRRHPTDKLRLKIAGKHYSDNQKDRYWQEQIAPQLDDDIQYIGFLDSLPAKRQFLGNAQALIVPSLFDEPFGMVTIEALACGTPLIGLDSGAIPEIVQSGKTGFVISKQFRRVRPSASFVAGKGSTRAHDKSQKSTEQQIDEPRTAELLANALENIAHIDRHACRADFEARFTLDQMAASHLAIYQQLAKLDNKTLDR